MITQHARHDRHNMTKMMWGVHSQVLPVLHRCVSMLVNQSCSDHLEGMHRCRAVLVNLRESNTVRPDNPARPHAPHATHGCPISWVGGHLCTPEEDDVAEQRLVLKGGTVAPLPSAALQHSTSSPGEERSCASSKGCKPATSTLLRPAITGERVWVARHDSNSMHGPASPTQGKLLCSAGPPANRLTNKCQISGKVRWV